MAAKLRDEYTVNESSATRMTDDTARPTMNSGRVKARRNSGWNLPNILLQSIACDVGGHGARAICSAHRTPIQPDGDLAHLAGVIGADARRDRNLRNGNKDLASIEQARIGAAD